MGDDMDRIFTLICTLLLAAGIAGGGVWAWDRHPPISAQVLFWRIRLPDSLQAQRDAALAASRIALDGQKRCDASLAVQNRSIAQASAAGAKAMALARKRLDTTKAVNIRLRSAAARLAAFAYVEGETSCQRWNRADGAVVAALMAGK